MTEHPTHGPRISGEEYDRRIADARRGLPPVLAEEQQRAFDRLELDLAIDLKLGIDFPRDRRDMLWRARVRTRTSATAALLTPALLAVTMVGRVLGRFAARRLQARCARSLETLVYREYAKVLAEDEFEQFFPSEHGVRQGLPIDIDEPGDRTAR